MTDSDPLEELRAKHDRNREQRLDAVKAWAAYVKEQPVDVWAPQQNRLIDSQLETARQSDIEPRRRIEDAKLDRRPE
jgi:hypothetical protein